MDNRQADRASSADRADSLGLQGRIVIAPHTDHRVLRVHLCLGDVRDVRYMCNVRAGAQACGIAALRIVLSTALYARLRVVLCIVNEITLYSVCNSQLV